MPIIPNTFTRATHPFFRSHVPYTLPAGQVECVTAGDMVSYNILPTSDTSINYSLGSFEEYRAELVVKNLTTDATLQISIVYDEIAFNIKRGERTIQSPVTETLNAGSSIIFIIEVNKEGLNNSTLYSNKKSSITMKIRNDITGKLLTKNVSVTGLSSTRQPMIVNVN